MAGVKRDKEMIGDRGESFIVEHINLFPWLGGTSRGQRWGEPQLQKEDSGRERGGKSRPGKRIHAAMETLKGHIGDISGVLVLR